MLSEVYKTARRLIKKHGYSVFEAWDEAEKAHDYMEELDTETFERLGKFVKAKGQTK